MKLKQILLNVLAVIMAFEYIGSNILAIMYPSWAGLVVGIMSAIAFIMVFNKAHFYKYEH
jgi:short-subunit dehydrogenase